MDYFEIKLTRGEKYFLACFYSGQQDILKPEYKDWVSLYSYLDSTHESLSQQKRFNKNEDKVISSALRIISNNVDNQRNLKRQIRSLTAQGIYISHAFQVRFESAANWFWYKESEVFIKKARSNYFKISNSNSNKNHNVITRNKEILEENYARAMYKLATNSFKLGNANSNKIAERNNDPAHQKFALEKYDESGKIAIIRPNEKNYMTSGGLNFFKQRLNDLKCSKDQFIDSKSKEHQSYLINISVLDSEINNIKNILSSIVEINSVEQINLEIIYFGATVKLLNSDQSVSVYKIVGIDEVSYSNDIKEKLNESSKIIYLSWKAPLAKALIKKEVGELVLQGNQQLEIVDIIYG